MLCKILPRVCMAVHSCHDEHVCPCFLSLRWGLFSPTAPAKLAGLFCHHLIALLGIKDTGSHTELSSYRDGN